MKPRRIPSSSVTKLGARYWMDNKHTGNKVDSVSWKYILGRGRSTLGVQAEHMVGVRLWCWDKGTEGWHQQTKGSSECRRGKWTGHGMGSLWRLVGLEVGTVGFEGREENPLLKNLLVGKFRCQMSKTNIKLQINVHLYASVSFLSLSWMVNLWHLHGIFSPLSF